MSFNFGKISKRISNFSKKFFIFLAIFSMSLMNFVNVFALDGAKWGSSDKSSIVYSGKTFTKSSDNSSLPNDLKNGTVFIYKTPANANGEQKAEVIIVNSTDSDKIDGTYYTFDVSTLGKYKKTNNGEKITGEGIDESSQSKTSCAIEGGGGWIVCMVANTIAGAVDGLYDVLSSFLRTQPLQVSSKSGLFQVWDYMRNIANVIFVIIFIIVIYSQITNIGISNYGIKKLLPKLIVAAVLINISYYICAIAIDLSNIIGAQLQNLLVGIRKDIVAEGFEVQAPNWAGLTTAILSGTAYLGYTFAAIGGWQGLAFAALGVLVVVIYSVFVAVVVLAARQAIITVLVFLAPLAFAANILPNTEKWFEKWKDTLTTMLVMYPLMAILFGGSQLAGTVIIANSNGSIVTLLLGMTVQIVPFAITPAIIKLSQGLLGRFAGMINNPNKGPVDAAKKFLEEGKQNAIQKRIKKGGNMTSLLYDGRAKRKNVHTSNKSLAEEYQRKRLVNKDVKNMEKADQTNSAFMREHVYLRNNTLYNNNLAKEIGAQTDAKASASYNEFKAKLSREVLKVNLEGEIIGIDQEKVKNLSKNLGKSSAALYNAMHESNAYKESAQNSQKVITNSIAETLKRDENLQRISEGAMGESGRTISLARAFEQATKLSEEEVKAANSLMKSMNFSNQDYAEAVHGRKVKTNADGSVMIDDDGKVQFEGNQPLDYIEKDGVKMKVDKTLKKAAVESYMGKVSIPEALQLLGETQSGGSLHEIRATVAEAISKNKKDDLQVLGGAFLGEAALNGVSYSQVIGNLTKGFHDKSSPEITTKMSDDTLKVVLSQPMSLDQQIATAKNMYIINQTDLATKVKANQGSEIHTFMESLSPSTLAKAQAEALAALQSQNPNISNIDVDLSNIKKKPKAT